MMIRVAKIGTRNRVVLPPEVIDLLGLEVGDAVFFVIRGADVRLSRSPENFAEYLHLHAQALPAVDELDEEIDPRQMRFGWADGEDEEER